MVHGTQHAGDKLVQTVALLHERDEGRDAALVGVLAEVGKDELLEGVDSVLQRHEVGNDLVALVGVVDELERHVLLVFESAVEVGVLVVEGELGQQVPHVLVDQRAVATHAVGAAAERLNPRTVGDGLLERNRVALLQDLVDGDKGLERLDFVGEDRLAGEGE